MSQLLLRALGHFAKPEAAVSSTVLICFESLNTCFLRLVEPIGLYPVLPAVWCKPTLWWHASACCRIPEPLDVASNVSSRGVTYVLWLWTRIYCLNGRNSLHYCCSHTGDRDSMSSARILSLSPFEIALLFLLLSTRYNSCDMYLVSSLPTCVFSVSRWTD